MKLTILIFIVCSLYGQKITNNFSLYQLGRATAESWTAAGENYVYPQNDSLQVSFNLCNSSKNTEIRMSQFVCGLPTKTVIEDLPADPEHRFAVARIKILTSDGDSSITNPFISQIAARSKNYTFIFLPTYGDTSHANLVGTQGNYYSNLLYYGSTGILWTAMPLTGSTLTLQFRDFYNYPNFSDAEVIFTIHQAY